MGVSEIYKGVLVKTMQDEKSFFKSSEVFSQYLMYAEEAKRNFAGVYEKYINTISQDNMAASSELASGIFALCRLKKPAKLLDLGSGFSSLVFRKYAASSGTNCEVISVDDNDQWLHITKNFLTQNHVSAEKVLSLYDFLESQEEDFDIILNDLNYVEVRRNYIQTSIDRTKSGGIIIFDDVHKTDYFFDVLKVLKANRMKKYSFRNTTLDKYNRFSIVAVKE